MQHKNDKSQNKRNCGRFATYNINSPILTLRLVASDKSYSLYIDLMANIIGLICRI